MRQTLILQIVAFCFVRALEEKINGFKVQEPVPEDDLSITVLASSTDIFLFYKSALTNCAKLSRKKPFLDLCKVFGKWLRVYANEVLLSKLPKQYVYLFCSLGS